MFEKGGDENFLLAQKYWLYTFTELGVLWLSSELKHLKTWPPSIYPIPQRSTETKDITLS